MALPDGRHALADALQANPTLWECLRRLDRLCLPEWYLGAGCIAQTVWNLAHGKDPNADILDYDLVYYDLDLSEARERSVEREARQLVADLHVELDVTNQARVHLWYPRHFGYRIPSYRSTEEAIETWPTTATAIGIRPRGDDIEAWAPFGTGDLFALVVRPNRVQITPDIYEAKVARWVARWPSLIALPWREGVGTPGLHRLDATTKDHLTGSGGHHP
jgi:hypothetical protein